MDLGWMRWGWWRRVGTGPEHLRRGRLGEDAARRRLQELGLRFLAANFRCPRGELDLVFRDGDCLVFVEVRARRGDAHGSPAESVVGRKAAKLAALAGDIPAEVLMSLPSPEEIARKAAEAKARAEAALQSQPNASTP